MAGAWPAVAWLGLKGWRRMLRLKGCAVRRMMLKGWLLRRARLRLRGGDGAERGASGCDVASSTSGGVAQAALVSWSSELSGS